MTPPPDPSRPNPSPGPPQTTNQAIETMLPPEPQPAGEEPLKSETLRDAAPEPATGRPAIPFRPLARPPMAMLTVCDDGKAEGEVIRIRGPRFVIGRTEGDLRIAIDSRISARHVEITLQTIGGVHHRWVVTDLQSTHGLFVRVSRMRLADHAELLVGGGRYQFDAPQLAPGATGDPLSGAPPSSQTHGWADDSAPARPPALTEVLGSEIGNRVLLAKPEYWIGSDPTCAFCRHDDPFCEPRHVRLYRKPSGAWHAENNRTSNGLWVRMPQITVESMVQFQIGEQRFRLRAT
jgi:pSer/pThr/pTyr-binding forkhead associated (FHA) protein